MTTLSTTEVARPQPLPSAKSNRGRFRLPRIAWAGFFILGLLLVIAVGAPWLSPYSPNESKAIPFQPPSAAHWLGTNDIGQDILSEVIWGTRISLLIGTLSALAISVIGLVVGLVAGYLGGWPDTLLMRVVDVILVLPFLPLSILLAAYLGPNFWNLVLVLGLLGWARPARVIRSQVLSVRSLAFIEVAVVCGAGSRYILRRHVMGAVLPLVAVQWIQAASSAILIESSLAFLGLGDPTQKSWGTILYYAQARSAFLTGAWVWWVLPPGLMITAAVFGFVLVGLGSEEIANPRLRKNK